MKAELPIYLAVVILLLAFLMALSWRGIYTESEVALRGAITLFFAASLFFHRHWRRKKAVK